MAPLRIGLIGGTGLGEALGARDGERVEVQTPFGPPSAPILMGELGGVEVAICQRHGEGHTFNPTRVPYRANIYALKHLGVTHIVAGGAVGSLREEIRPRDLVVASQILDRTHQRATTFYEQAAVHVEFSEPFCPVMRRWLLAAGQGQEDFTVHAGAGGVAQVLLSSLQADFKSEDRLIVLGGYANVGLTYDLGPGALTFDARYTYVRVSRQNTLRGAVGGFTILAGYQYGLF